ncbi:MAG: dihydroxy-acid dehydratase, partial [Mangrovicoccus sp.]
LANTALAGSFRPAGEILDERAFVNGMIGLMATGGSTNLVLHLPAMARAAGVLLDLQDFEALSEITPLMAKVYPNGMADVNHFHAAGGLGYMIGQLIEAGLLHEDVNTILGQGLSQFAQEPVYEGGKLSWRPAARESLNDKILRPVSDPFQPTGGLKQLSGRLGRGVMKVSAVKPEHRVVEAPVRVFHDQDSVKDAFKAGEFTGDTVILVRFQGPRANGMPELHGLTPVLSVLQDRGYKVALVTDGRMSGASGKVPAAIHVTPEATEGGVLARIQDGDIIKVDAETGILETTLSDEVISARAPAQPDLSANGFGLGRELFEVFRSTVGSAADGAGVAVGQAEKSAPAATPSAAHKESSHDAA